MPKGRANPDRKGSTIKPNTNAEAQMNLAADPATDPQELVPEGADAARAEAAPPNEAATEQLTVKYQRFIQEIQSLDFVNDESMADAAAKAVLGHLASRLQEPQARKLTQNLPDPLTYEKLRGQQMNVNPISAEQFFTDISEQFQISSDRARNLVNKVLHLAKDTVEEQALSEVNQSLPSDWTNVMQAA